MRPQAISRAALSACTLLLFTFAAACRGEAIARTASAASPPATPSAAELMASSAAAARARTLTDVGAFVHGASPVRAQNRATASVVHLAAGDTIEFPPGMTWDPPPGVSAGPPGYLMPSVSVGGQTLYITVFTGGSGAQFESIDGRDFRMAPGGDVIIYVQDSDRADHQAAVDATGHLLLDPAPVAGNLVAIYASGEALDVSGMTAAGRLAPVRRTRYPTEWYFTMCEAGRCTLSYRVGPLVAPFSGTIVCQNGAEFDLHGNGFRLQFRDAGTLRNNPTWAGGSPAACGQSRKVRAGAVITSSFLHYIVSAVSASGAPLSVAVASDGTLYVGRLTASANCPPCRGS